MVAFRSAKGRVSPSKGGYRTFPRRRGNEEGGKSRVASGNPAAGAFGPMVQPGVIFYSVATMAMETMPELAGWAPFFYASEVVVVLIFTTEYFVRWRWADHPARPTRSAAGLIDLLAILPFYLAVGLDLRGSALFACCGCSGC